MVNSSSSSVVSTLDLVCDIVRNINTRNCTARDVIRLHQLADIASQLAQAWEHETRERALEEQALEQAVEQWELAERFCHDIHAACGK